MTILLGILMVVGIAWLVMSSVLWTYWHVNKSPRSDEDTWGCLIAGGAFIGYVAVLGSGVYQCLFFLPDSLGSWDGSGEWVTIRSTISATIGLGGAHGMMTLLTRHGREKPRQ